MKIIALPEPEDISAMVTAQGRTFSHHPRRVKMSLADKMKEKAAAIRAGKTTTKKESAVSKKRVANNSKPEKKEHRAAKKARTNNKDTAGLREKVLAMRKKDIGYGEIAEKLGISDSYAWVLATNYKYSGKKKGKK